MTAKLVTQFELCCVLCSNVTTNKKETVKTTQSFPERHVKSI